MGTIYSTGSSTATASSGAATLTTPFGTITTESLTTAQDATYTLTITMTGLKATDICMASIANGTNSAGTPILKSVAPAADSLVIVVINKHASAVALNGTLKISVAVFGA